MSKHPKKHKKRKKHSRRERHAAASSPRPAAGALPVTEAGPAATPDPPEQPPVTEDMAPAPKPAPAAEPASVTATFTPSTKTEVLVAEEQRWIARDLKRLGVQVLVFIALVAAIGVWDAQTGIVSALGTSLFGLWG